MYCNALTDNVIRNNPHLFNNISQSNLHRSDADECVQYIVKYCIIWICYNPNEIYAFWF